MLPSVARAAMAQARDKIPGGVFAVNKPAGISSAQVLRDMQTSFNPSSFFAAYIRNERDLRKAESHQLKRKRRSRSWQPVQVKIGHGGTLDPMATGVLITGIGSGTKELSKFLACTKSYEAVVLFGAATDTYDRMGKIIARKPFSHITKDSVEQALSKFRGKIMQRPPIYSALRLNGKRLYEYARDGLELPKQIEERPVEVLDLQLVEWMDGGEHSYRWPQQEAEKEEKQVAEKVLHLEDRNVTPDQDNASAPSPSSDLKRKVDREDAGIDQGSDFKKAKLDPEVTAGQTTVDAQPTIDTEPQPTEETSKEGPSPPAVRLRMTVTSGFYVRSLCHDLGEAVDSLAIMSDLVRTRQGDFELGKNVLEYSDLAKGEEVWAPQVDTMLDAWNSGNGVSSPTPRAESPS